MTSHRPLVFLNASLSSLAEKELNKQLERLVVDCGGRVFLPQRELPQGAGLTPADILDGNSAGVLKSDLILSVLDKPGLGVAYELGVAVSASKPILMFRTDTGHHLGKIIEGLWQRQPPEMTATSMSDLEMALKRTFSDFLNQGASSRESPRMTP